GGSDRDPGTREHVREGAHARVAADGRVGEDEYRPYGGGGGDCRADQGAAGAPASNDPTASASSGAESVDRMGPDPDRRADGADAVGSCGWAAPDRGDQFVRVQRDERACDRGGAASGGRGAGRWSPGGRASGADLRDLGEERACAPGSRGAVPRASRGDGRFVRGHSAHREGGPFAFLGAAGGDRGVEGNGAGEALDVAEGGDAGGAAVRESTRQRPPGGGVPLHGTGFAVRGDGAWVVRERSGVPGCIGSLRCAAPWGAGGAAPGGALWGSRGSPRPHGVHAACALCAGVCAERAVALVGCGADGGAGAQCGGVCGGVRGGGVRSGGWAEADCCAGSADGAAACGWCDGGGVCAGG